VCFVFFVVEGFLFQDEKGNQLEIICLLVGEGIVIASEVEPLLSRHKGGMDADG